MLYMCSDAHRASFVFICPLKDQMAFSSYYY